jgi:hypothetical protein
LILSTLLLPTTSIGQTLCAAPNRCLSAERVNDVTDALCARARAKEAAFDVVRGQADGLLLNAARCEGRAAELDAQRIVLQAALDVARAESAGRYRLITVVVVGVLSLLIGGGVGALAF